MFWPTPMWSKHVHWKIVDLHQKWWFPSSQSASWSEGTHIPRWFNPENVAGWWYTYPSEKWWTSSVGMMTFPTEWKVIKSHGSSHHQPDGDFMWRFPTEKLGSASKAPRRSLRNSGSVQGWSNIWSSSCAGNLSGWHGFWPAKRGGFESLPDGSFIAGKCWKHLIRMKNFNGT